MKKSPKTTRCLWIAIFLLLTLPLRAQTPGDALRTFLDSPSLDRNQTAVYIWDVEADYLVAAYNEELPVTPASVMKCVTTGALRSAMPYSATLQTKVYLEGTKTGDSFSGNIVVVGAGDPSLGDGRHKGQVNFPEKIVSALAGKGIKNLNGKIIIDDSLFSGPAVHPSWQEGDLTQSYGTGVHAFNYEGNASGKKAVSNPGAVFIRQLREAMERAGINYTEAESKTGGKRTQLLSYSSPRLDDLMRSCMFRSDNLYAETFLRLFGLQNGTDGSVAGSARVAMQHWDALNYPTDGIEIADGSGLSRRNLLTAEFLGLVLRNLKDDMEYVSFFPLVGEEGTVKSFLQDTPLQGYMALKTGSMNGIQSYAGYVLDEDFAPTHVVVVMTNNLKNRGEYRKALERLFLTLFR